MLQLRIVQCLWNRQHAKVTKLHQFFIYLCPFLPLFHSLTFFLDLKAFERRLTEVIACLQPSTLRYRSKYSFSWIVQNDFYLLTNKIPIPVILVTAAISISIGAWYWLTDPKTSVVPLFDSLLLHPLFALSSMILIILFCFGIHKKVIAPQIITSRTRSVLSDFNLSIDDSGKLILKQRPTN